MSIHRNVIGVPPSSSPSLLPTRLQSLPEKLEHGFIGRDVNDPRYVLLGIDYPTGAHFLA